MIGLVGALQFLTRIPIRTSTAIAPRRTIIWFPVVGLLVGSVSGAIASSGQELTTPLVAASVAVAVGLAITGAFHEDGLADLSDAIAGGWTRERRLEILADPCHGTYGVSSLVVSVVVRVACVASLGPAAAFAGLVAAHSLGRGAAVAVMPFARPRSPDRAGDDPGLGAGASRAVSPGRAVTTVALAVVIAAVAIGWWVAVVVPVAVVAATTIAVIAVRALGTVSGDALGAIEQVVEMTTLVTTSALAAHHALWWP